jgi:cytochrome P450
VTGLISERAPAGPPMLRAVVGLRRDPLATLLDARRTYGDVVYFPVGPGSFYAVFHPRDVQRVLQSNADAFRKDNVFYEEIRWAFGNGLLTSQDADWQRQRRFVQPLFTRRRIDGYAAIMAAEAERLLADWRPIAAAGGTVDLDAGMTALTLRIVGRILFGADTDEVLPVVRDAFGVVGAHARRRAYSPLAPPRSWPTSRQRRAAAARRAMHEACQRLIDARRRARTEGDDLLGRLLAARDDEQSLTDAEVRDQVLIFLLAGHDTTAIAVTMALYLLARDAAVQARVRAEAREFHVGGDPTDLGRLAYTTAVLKEAMRLYPPAWGIGRRTPTGDVLGGQTIPPGSDMLVSPWVTHRHPDVWPDPERFDPDRFTADDERHRYAWFPFGGGPRACIGQHFSLLEAALVLAAAVRQFTFTAIDDAPVRLVPRITLRPAHEVRCRLGPA